MTTNAPIEMITDDQFNAHRSAFSKFFSDEDLSEIGASQSERYFADARVITNAPREKVIANLEELTGSNFVETLVHRNLLIFDYPIYSVEQENVNNRIFNFQEE